MHFTAVMISTFFFNCPKKHCDRFSHIGQPNCIAPSVSTPNKYPNSSNQHRYRCDRFWKIAEVGDEIMRASGVNNGEAMKELHHHRASGECEGKEESLSYFGRMERRQRDGSAGLHNISLASRKSTRSMQTARAISTINYVGFRVV